MIVRNNKTNLYVVRTKLGSLNLLPGKNGLKDKELAIWEDAKKTKETVKTWIRLNYLEEVEQAKPGPKPKSKTKDKEVDSESVE